MVVVFGFYTSGKTMGDGGCPDNNKPILVLIVKKFRRPYIYGLWFMFHHGDNLLFLPMYQISRTCITNSFIAFPGNRPDEVVHTVFIPNHRRVAHDLLRSHLRL